MKKVEIKRKKRVRRRLRIRARVRGTSAKPRLAVFRSNRHVWVQCVDDMNGRTIASASDIDVRPKKSVTTSKKDKSAVALRMKTAELVGELIAKRAVEKKIQAVVFDRSGYKYHGIVRAVAEGARKGGLTF